MNKAIMRLMTYDEAIVFSVIVGMTKEGVEPNTADIIKKMSHWEAHRVIATLGEILACKWVNWPIDREQRRFHPTELGSLALAVWQDIPF